MKALLNGDYACARDCYMDIHKQNPTDIRTFIKLAEMKQRVGDIQGAIADYINIASGYAENGFIVQAIAINKIILRLDPENEGINKKLQDLSCERGEEWATYSDSVAVEEHSNACAALRHSQKLSPGVKRTPLLSGLSGEELNAFIQSLELTEYSPQEIIYHEGDTGGFLYLIARGSVRLQTTLNSGETTVYDHFQEGDFFGERAFMSHLKHRNSALVEVDSSILVIERATFEQWVARYPQILETVEEFYRQRVLAWVLAVTPLFEGVPFNIRKALAEKFNVCRFRQGDIILEQGDIGDSFYLIRSGRVIVSATSRKDGAARDVELGQLEAGSFFGEVTMLTNRPRTATVIAGEDVEVMELTRKNFDIIAKYFPPVRKVVETYLKKRVKDTIEVMVKRN